MHVVLRDLIEERLAQLASYARRIVDCAAVIGYRIDANFLAAATDSSPETIAAALASACALDLVVDESGHEPRFRFRHALTRAAIYQNIGGVRKRRLHAKVARALETLPGRIVRSVELAHHWRAAGRPLKAIHYERLAAREAQRLDVAVSLRGGR